MKVSFLITNCGDGSNSLEWFWHTLNTDQLEYIEKSNNERYSSGDGIQYKELEVHSFFFEDNPYLHPLTYDEWVEENEQYYEDNDVL